MNFSPRLLGSLTGVALVCMCVILLGAANERSDRARLERPAFPPTLPGGREMVTDTSPAFLKRPRPCSRRSPSRRRADDRFPFLSRAGLSGKPVVGVGRQRRGEWQVLLRHRRSSGAGGNAFVYEYDPATKKLRRLVDVEEAARLPEGHYTPGKIHSRIDLGERRLALLLHASRLDARDHRRSSTTRATGSSAAIRHGKAEIVAARAGAEALHPAAACSIPSG